MMTLSKYSLLVAFLALVFRWLANTQAGCSTTCKAMTAFMPVRMGSPATLAELYKD